MGYGNTKRGGHQLPVVPVADRLWAKIDVGAPDACWPWTAHRDKDGYGQLTVEGVSRRAHVLVLEEKTGEPADGRLTCHACDNPPCCNPGHLSWGTHASNHAERNARGRQARGERSGQAKLTHDQVVAIRARHVYRCKTNGTLAIARDYGVSKSTVDCVVRGLTWSGN